MCCLCRFIQVGCWLSCRIDDKSYSRTACRRRSVKCETLPLTRTNMFRFLCQVVSEVGIKYQWRRRHHHKMSSLDLWHPHFVSPATVHWDCRDVWRCVVEKEKYEHSWVIMILEYPCLKGSMSFNHFSCIMLSWWSFTTPSSLNAAPELMCSSMGI